MATKKSKKVNKSQKVATTEKIEVTAKTTASDENTQTPVVEEVKPESANEKTAKKSKNMNKSKKAANTEKIEVSANTTVSDENAETPAVEEVKNEPTEVKDEIPKSKKSAKRSKVEPEAAAVSDAEAKTPPAEDIYEEPAEVQQSKELIYEVPLELIVPNTKNPRRLKRINIEQNEGIVGLAQNMSQIGLRNAIELKAITGADGESTKFMIVAGERRFWAAHINKWRTIPAKFVDGTDKEAYQITVSENIQREQLNIFEQSTMFHEMLKSGETADSLSKVYGFPKNQIRAIAKFVDLIPEFQELINQREISFNVGLTLCKFDPERQKQIYSDHFSGYYNWKELSSKKIIAGIEREYSTQLDDYGFDKTECLSCYMNSGNDNTLFEEFKTCATCKDMKCLKRKNSSYLISEITRYQELYPALELCIDEDFEDAEIVKFLEEMGYRHIYAPVFYMTDLPEEPGKPQRNNYETEEDFRKAAKKYAADLSDYEKEVQELEEGCEKGEYTKYICVVNNEVSIKFDESENSDDFDDDDRIGDESEGERVPTSEGAEVNGVMVMPKKKRLEDLQKIIRALDSEMYKIKKDGERKRELLFRNFLNDFKKNNNKLGKITKTELSALEERLKYFYLMDKMGYTELENLCKGAERNDDKRWAFTENLTPEQKVIIERAYLEYNFRGQTEFQEFRNELFSYYLEEHYPVEKAAAFGPHEKIYLKRMEKVNAAEKEVSEKLAIAKAELAELEGKKPVVKVSEEIEFPDPIFDTDIDYYGNEPKEEPRRIPFEYLRIIYNPEPAINHNEDYYSPGFMPEIINIPSGRPQIVS